MGIILATADVAKMAQRTWKIRPRIFEAVNLE